MKALPFVLSIVATAVAVLALATALSSRDGEIELLRERIASLERGARPAAPGTATTHPSTTTERPRRSRRAQPAAPSDPPVAPEPPAPVVRPPVAPATANAATAHGNAQTFMTGWVQSFENEPQGSEFFRLAVEAFAAELVPDLRGYLSDARQPPALRLAIARILASERFRDDANAIDALVDALQTSPTGELATAVIEGIAAGGGPRHAVRLEALVPTTQDATARAALIQGVAATAGDHANAALLRLYDRESKEGLRARIVASLNARDETNALAVIDRASREKHYPIRNRGAEKLGAFRSEHARTLLAEWAAREKERAVLARLSDARALQDAIPSYDVRRVLGPPDVPTPGSDHVNAWCPLEKNAGTEWLELTYDTVVEATLVRIYEVYTGGSVERVEVREPGRGWRVAWEGTADARSGGTFETRLASPGTAVNAVRITFDTARHDGWHEIDAVELVGPDGSAYATGAKASSTWGQ